MWLLHLHACIPILHMLHIIRLRKFIYAGVLHLHNATVLVYCNNHTENSMVYTCMCFCTYISTCSVAGIVRVHTAHAHVIHVHVTVTLVNSPTDMSSNPSIFSLPHHVILGNKLQTVIYMTHTGK